MSKLFLAAFFFCLVPISGVKAESALDRPLDLKFTAVDGREVNLAKMRGKVVLLDFWATWCPNCRLEMPGVVALYKQYHKQGFEVVGISLDQDKDTMLEYTRNNGMEWPQYFDGQMWDNAISSNFGVQEIPLMLLIGKDGKIVAPQGDRSLETMVKKLVAKE